MVKKILKSSIIFFLKKILYLSCIFNLPFLAYLILDLLARKSKKIKHNQSSKKTLIILEKSYGIEDLYLTFKKNGANCKIVILNREYVRIIYDFFLENYKNQIKDNTYLSSNPLINYQKKKYKNFFKEIIKYFIKHNNLIGFVGFNFLYKIEREIQNACHELKVKFICCMKEGISPHKNWVISSKFIWKNYVQKCNISALSCYNNYVKKTIHDFGVIDKNKITVVGMPRADYYYNNKKK